MDNVERKKQGLPYCYDDPALLGDEHIFIGDNCLIAPNVVFSTSGPPILPILMEHHYVYNLLSDFGRAGNNFQSIFFRGPSGERIELTQDGK